MSSPSLLKKKASELPSIQVNTSPVWSSITNISNGFVIIKNFIILSLLISIVVFVVMYVKRKQESEDDINNLRVSDALYKEREKQTKRELEVINEDVDKLITNFNEVIRDNPMCTIKTVEGNLILTYTMAYGLNKIVLTPDEGTMMPVEDRCNLIVTAFYQEDSNILLISQILIQNPHEENETPKEKREYNFTEKSGIYGKKEFTELRGQNFLIYNDDNDNASNPATAFCAFNQDKCTNYFDTEVEYSLVTNKAGKFVFKKYKQGDENERNVSTFVETNDVKYDKISNLIELVSN